jgi:hypothetical protein
VVATGRRDRRAVTPASAANRELMVVTIPDRPSTLPAVAGQPISRGCSTQARPGAAIGQVTDGMA